MQKNTSNLSRRKVTAGIAWSVPAVAAVADHYRIAAAAAFAAGGSTLTASAAGSAGAQ